MGEIIFYILLFVLAIGVWAFYSNEKEEKSMRIQKLRGMANQLNDHVYKINTVKTTRSKLNNCEKALTILYAATQYKEYKEVFLNHDELIKKLNAIEIVLPVVDYLGKADKNRFKQKEGPEKNALLDALYEIENNNIQDSDFAIADVRDDKTGELVTISKIESRLEELGWVKEN